MQTILISRISSGRHQIFSYSQKLCFWNFYIDFYRICWKKFGKFRFIVWCIIDKIEKNHFFFGILTELFGYNIVLCKKFFFLSYYMRCKKNGFWNGNLINSKLSYYEITKNKQNQNSYQFCSNIQNINLIVNQSHLNWRKK